MRRKSAQRSRGSSCPRRRPAREWGWQGMPPTTPETCPRNCRPSKVLASSQTGAGARRPACIAATRWATAKASLSTIATARLPGIARCSPRSSPAPPVQMERYRPESGPLPRSGRRATFMPPPRRSSAPRPEAPRYHHSSRPCAPGGRRESGAPRPSRCSPCAPAAPPRPSRNRARPRRASTARQETPSRCSAAASRSATRVSRVFMAAPPGTTARHRPACRHAAPWRLPPGASRGRW